MYLTILWTWGIYRVNIVFGKGPEQEPEITQMNTSANAFHGLYSYGFGHRTLFYAKEFCYYNKPQGIREAILDLFKQLIYR